MNELLAVISKRYPLSEIALDDMKTVKAAGMTFMIRAFYAEGLGHVSVMSAKGFLGLMKMDTLIINPLEKDLPLYSYDRILAMGNDTLIIEVYDTLTGPCDLHSMQKVKEMYSHLPEHVLGEHWYDSIKLPESVSVKEKSKSNTRFDAYTKEHLKAYFRAKPGSDTVDAEKKKEKASVYVEGLLKNGGPSTSVFLKHFGEEKTAVLFRKYLFGTEK